MNKLAINLLINIFGDNIAVHDRYGDASAIEIKLLTFKDFNFIYSEVNELYYLSCIITMENTGKTISNKFLYNTPNYFEIVLYTRPQLNNLLNNKFKYPSISNDVNLTLYADKITCNYFNNDISSQSITDLQNAIDDNFNYLVCKLEILDILFDLGLDFSKKYNIYPYSIESIFSSRWKKLKSGVVDALKYTK